MDFLSSADFSRKQIEEIFSIADHLNNGNYSFVDDGTILALLFEKPSTRTRVSFEAAMVRLGGDTIYIDASTSQLSRGEKVGDTGRVLGSYVDMIAARLYRQADLIELAESTDVPVINALTELEHPCQALSDLYTIRGHFGKTDGVRIAFVGDAADNVANSLMVSGTRLGADIVLVGPKGVKPNEKYLKLARQSGNVGISNDLKMGLKDADIVYTDTFVSMGQEKEAEERRRIFAPYQVNAHALELAREDALVMHCLPAHRGEEITDDVLDGPRSIVWEQAKNKMLIAKAVLLFLSV